MRVEIGVEDDYSVCTPQVDPDASSACRQKVNKDVRVGLVEFVHVLLTVGLLRVAILTRSVKDRYRIPPYTV